MMGKYLINKARVLLSRKMKGASSDLGIELDIADFKGVFVVA